MLEATEGLGMQNPVTVSLKAGPNRIGIFKKRPSLTVPREHGKRGEELRLSLFNHLPHMQWHQTQDVKQAVQAPAFNKE